jgi:long-chain-fatty-acid---luciferin-component ligase
VSPLARVAVGARVAVAVTRMRAANYDSLDQMLYEGTDSYRGDWAAQRFDWVLEALDHHLVHSQPYKRLAQGMGFRISDLEESRNLDLIPLLSSGSFKQNLFGIETNVMRCASSGTMGSISVVPRDARTIERFIGSIAHGMKEFFDQTERQRGFILGPRPEEARDLWFAYSWSLTSLYNDVDYFVRGESLQAEAAYEALRAAEADDNAEPAIAASPSMLVALLEWMAAHGVSLDLGQKNSWVITAGGWKKAAQAQIDQVAFRADVVRRLGLAPTNIRDIFNMVELNSIIFECEAGAKHVPPWLEVSARSPYDLKTVEPGEVGVLAYLDPSPLSYPGFILSDDLGTVSDDPCSCGRNGPILTLTRRLEAIEERGCGLKMSRYASAGAEL